MKPNPLAFGTIALLLFGCSTFREKQFPETVVWGKGVVDPSRLLAVVEDMAKDNGFRRVQAQGMILSMTWEQALEAATTVEASSAARHNLMACLLGIPDSRRRLIGKTEDEIAERLGPPCAMEPNKLIYKGHVFGNVNAHGSEPFVDYIALLGEKGTVTEIQERWTADGLVAYEPLFRDNLKWGSGVLSREFNIRQAEKLMDGTMVCEVYLGEGMLLALSWEQAYESYRNASSGSYVKHALHQFLFKQIEARNNSAADLD